MTTHRTAIVAALVLFTSVTTGSAVAQVGIAAGLNFDNLGDIDTQSGRSTFDNATGYHIGIFADLGIGPVKVRPGVFYRDAGEVVSNLGDVPRKSDLAMIEVPVDVRVQVLPTPIVQPYLTAGPVFSFASSNDKEFNASLRDWSVAANVGAGVSLALPGVGLKVFPEVRYAFGVSRFIEDTIQFNDVTFQAEDPVRLNTIMVRLGVIL